MSMKKQFFKRLLLFLMLALAINFLLDRLYKGFVVHNLLNNAVDEQFEAYDDTLKYLSLGNSHNCINTYILDHSFNYMAPGEHYIQTYYKLNHIIEKEKKIPENIILFIDVADFNPVLSNRFEYNSYWVKYLDYFEIARVKGERKILAKWLEGKFFSYAGNYKDIELSIIYRIKIKHVELHNGYRPHRDYRNFAEEKDKVKAGKEKVGIYLTREEYLDKDLLYYFEKILRMCLDHHINVILVRIPVTREYYQEASRVIPVDKLYQDLEDSYNKYPNVLHVFDYHDLYFDHPEYFFDADHLNPKGSDLFTIRLKEDLKSLNFSE